MPTRLALALLLLLLLASQAAAARAGITTSVSGTCTVSATLTWSNMQRGSSVDIEFLPTFPTSTYSDGNEAVTTPSGSFTHSHTFAPSDNGSWVAHFTFFYTGARPAYERYKSFTVSC